MEKEISEKALELVTKAMTLLGEKKYDEVINLLRQAINLYQEINRDSEINALRSKIAELYVLKESDHEKQELEKESSQKTDKFLKEAEDLIANNQFEKALNKYEEAINIFKENNNDVEIQRVYELIEKCYVAKAKLLRESKKEEPKKEEIEIEQSKPEKIVEKSLEPQMEPKKLEEEQTPEAQDFEELISDLAQDHEKLVEEFSLDDESEKLKSIEDKYKKEFEDEAFQQEITELADNAEKMVREYELEIKKDTDSLKKLEPPYEKAIEIYSDIRKRLVDYGWVKELELYDSQIKLCRQKLEQDKRLRQIELEKKEKEKVFLETQKIQKQEEIDIKKLKAVEEKFRQEFEDGKFQEKVTEIVGDAEKIVRQYELEIKKGNFDLEPPYEKVIEIYTDIRNQLSERNWIDQLEIYNNQIRIYQQKLEQDKKLRSVEAQKREKEKAFIDSQKVQKEDVSSTKKHEEKIEEKYQEGIEEAKFQNQVTALIDEADSLEREYESNKKKAIREKKLLELQSPFPRIIEIYEKLREMLLKKGWVDQAEIYKSQIQIYYEKFERDKILREIEAHKLGK
jgi:hypothetical protein